MAGLGRRTFQAGEVLTASNVMAYLQDQAVMNFAGTAARGSAIGTAVSEGMISYLADSNVVQAYDGSAWNSLAYATAVPTLAQTGLRPIIPSSVAVGSGSASISTNGRVTFTGASSISLNGIFNSTYASYRIIIEGDSSTAAADVRLRLRSSGTDLTSSTYYYGGYLSYASSGAGQDSQGGTSSWHIGYVVNTAAGFYSSAYDITGPGLPKRTAFIGASAGYAGSGIIWTAGSGFNDDNNTYDGLTIFPSSGNITGKVQVYGYTN